MKDRKTFITISTLLAAALIAAITMSAVWITGTYRERQEDFASAVESALLQARLSESRCRESGENGRHVIISRVIEDSLIKTYTYPADFSSLGIDEIADVTGMDFTRYGKEAKKIHGMEMPEDPVTGFITARFLLVFYNALDKMNIPRQEFRFTITSRPGNDTLYCDPGTIKNHIGFEIPLLAAGQSLTCHVETENPEKMFLTQMSGIIISTSAIAIILCLSYIYLIRTVFRQKSLEEMRKDFTHNVTHELKTPIATARAATEALLEYSADEDRQKRQRYLSMMKDQLGILSDMVEKILDMSVQESDNFTIHPEKCRPKEILQDLCNGLRVKSPGILIEEDYPENDITITADSFHISNAIANILDNAAKYVSGEPHIRVILRENGKNILISIQDNGAGIPVSEKKRIFEKYYRIPTGNIQNVKGFGIGLYYSNLIVEKHGGSISVSPAGGGGSVFSIHLPCRMTEK